MFSSSGLSIIIIVLCTKSYLSLKGFFRIRDYFIKARKFMKEPDWFMTFATALEKIEKLKEFYIDISAGAYLVSYPDELLMKDAAVKSNQQSLSLISIVDGKSNITYVPTTVSPILRVHQFSRSFLKKFPDSALLGILTLSSLELIQRQLNNQATTLPPLLKEAANITTENLNTKLEILSSLSWDFDPFLKAELDALQSQPLEVIENFLIKDLLPRIDKDISPIILRMIADPQQVKLVTKFIKSFIVEMADDIHRSTGGTVAEPLLPIQATAMKIIQNVEQVGLNFEEGIKEWNKALLEITNLTKRDNVIKYVRSWLLPNSKYTIDTTFATNTTTSSTSSSTSSFLSWTSRSVYTLPYRTFVLSPYDKNMNNANNNNSNNTTATTSSNIYKKFINEFP